MLLTAIVGAAAIGLLWVLDFLLEKEDWDDSED